MKFLSSFLIALSLLFSSSAFSLVEVRGSYVLVSTSGVNDNDNNVPNMKTPAGLAADILGVFDNFVGGLRYENITERKSTGMGTGYEAKYSRTALVGSYRFLNETYFLGPIATLGLTSNLDYTYNALGGSNVGLNAKNQSNYSIGVEGGFQALGYMVSAELGYLSAKIGDLKSKNTGADVISNGQPISADMSGVYTRITAGFTF